MDQFRAERSALALAEGRQKLDRILDSPDPAGLIRSLPAEDLYFAIQEIGLADSGDIVQLAAPEQFRTFVDLDAWHGYELDTSKVLFWLRVARGDDDEAYTAKLHSLDVEVLELLIRDIVQVFDLEEDPEPVEDFEGTVERTVEGRFLLVYTGKGAEYGAAKRLIDDLYTEDAFLAGRFLYAVRWGIESDLSETALRWRSARLADLGFPSQEEAASLYARVDLSAALPGPPGVVDQPPGFFLSHFLGDTLLDEAMALVEGARRNDLELELVGVLNAALVADQIPPSELEAVREVAASVRSTITVGLESLAGADAAVAAEFLSGTALKRIFQIGFTKTLELRWRADKLRTHLPLELERGTFLPDGVLGERVAALFSRRPRYFAPASGRTPDKVRAFASLAELEETSLALDEIEAVGAAFLAAGLEVEAAKELILQRWGEVGIVKTRWSDLLLTTASRKIVGLEPGFVALPLEKLEEAARATFHADGSILPEAREVVLSLLGDDERVRHFANGALSRLEEEVGSQVAATGFEHLDPRFVSPWIVG